MIQHQSLDSRMHHHASYIPKKQLHSMRAPTKTVYIHMCIYVYIYIYIYYYQEIKQGLKRQQSSRTKGGAKKLYYETKWQNVYFHVLVLRPNRAFIYYFSPQDTEIHCSTLSIVSRQRRIIPLLTFIVNLVFSYYEYIGG